MTEVQPAWSWSRIARRIRVPLGFLFAAFYLWRARPDWLSLVAGGAVAAVGLFVRAMASGHVQKNEQLASTGPYAYCRNPRMVRSKRVARSSGRVPTPSPAQIARLRQPRHLQPARANPDALAKDRTRQTEIPAVHECDAQCGSMTRQAELQSS